MSNFLYGGNVHANGIRQHYLRYGGARGAGRDPVIIVPGITSPAITWGFVGERFGESFDTTSWMCAAGACPRPARR